MYFRYVKNELIKRKGRAMFVILGVALSIGIFVTVNTLANAFMDSIQKPLQDCGTDIIIQRSGDTPDDFGGASLPCSQVVITASEVAQLRGINGVRQMSTALLMWVFEDEGNSSGSNFAIVTGMIPDQKIGPGIANNWLVEGTGLRGSTNGEALVESVYANQKGIKLGDTITITGLFFEVAGIVRTPVNSLISVSNIYISLDDAQRIASSAKNIPNFMPGDVNEVFLQAAPEDISAIIKEINKVAPGASVTSQESLMEAIGGIAAQSRTLANFTSIIVLLLALVVVAKTISGNTMERRNEIGIMKTVGWTSKNIYYQIISETFSQSVIGGILGISIGFLAAMMLGRIQISIPVSWDIDPYPHFMMTDTSQKTLEVDLSVKASIELFSLALAVAIVVGVLSAFLTLRNINTIKPSEVLRNE